MDLSTDYLVWDNTEAVSVVLVRNGGSTTVSVSVANRGAMTRADSEFNGIGMDERGVSWSIPEAILNPGGQGRVIKRDDKIVDANGVVFRVVSADFRFNGNKWRVASVQER